MASNKSNLLGRGYVQVYTGNCKGKTTAALGLAFRSAGHWLKTYIGQLMKGQSLWILGGSGVDDFSAFYITRERGEILPKKYEALYEINHDIFYIGDDNWLSNKDYLLYYTYNTHWQKRKLKLVKILHEYPYPQKP